MMTGRGVKEDRINETRSVENREELEHKETGEQCHAQGKARGATGEEDQPMAGRDIGSMEA
eukprot:766092-Hanusia_phi.AAC.6